MLSLAALVGGLACLLVPTLSSSAAPRPATVKTTRPTVNRAALNQANAINAAAAVARAKRYAKTKKGVAVYMVQARNPNWTRSGMMTQDQAVLSTLALRRQGLGAHVHNMGSSGSFVHYGMVHWLTRGAVTNRTLAHAVSAHLRALGLQSRVVTRVYNR
jgi:hypothetical protein